LRETSTNSLVVNGQAERGPKEVDNELSQMSDRLGGGGGVQNITMSQEPISFSTCLSQQAKRHHECRALISSIMSERVKDPRCKPRNCSAKGAREERTASLWSNWKWGSPRAIGMEMGVIVTDGYDYDVRHREVASKKMAGTRRYTKKQGFSLADRRW